MLKNIYVLKFRVKLLTGLYIGGNDDGFDIGGADTNVIKNPITKEPYIPGSSLKGKLRSLLSYIHGNLEKDTIKLSGELANIFEPIEEKQIKMTRGIFRDCVLTEESKELLKDKLGVGVFTEIKAENKINPIKGTAEPRFIERVPAGVEFAGEIVLNVFDEDDAEEMKRYILKALKLLEHNYLGGSGSRGYGRVKIELINQFEEVYLDGTI